MSTEDVATKVVEVLRSMDKAIDPADKVAILRAAACVIEAHIGAQSMVQALRLSLDSIGRPPK